MVSMKHVLGTVHPALHEKLLTRMLHMLIAGRLSSVLVIPPASELDNPLARLKEASALKRLGIALDKILPAFKDKILNNFLGMIFAARITPISPYSRTP